MPPSNELLPARMSLACLMLLPNHFSLEKATMLATRKLPLVLRRSKDTMELVANLPEGSVVTHVPTDLHVADPCFTFDRTSKTHGSKLTVTTSFQETCTEVAPADYPRFREAVQRVAVTEHDSFMFGPKDGRAALKKP